MCRSDKNKPSQKDESEKQPSSKTHALSLRDFFDQRNPWDLRDRVEESEAIKNWFKFVPRRFTEGPWLPFVTWTMVSTVCYVVYATIDANIKYNSRDSSNSNDYNSSVGIMEDFVGDKSYTAFTIGWYYNVVLFFWTSYVAWTIYDFHKGFTAWITYTICSWTLICVRHGLCSIAPFFPSVRLLVGMMRFPLLLSASVTFGMWNFALMPAITFGFLEGERRWKFVRWAFNWKMCQIHIFNILWAYLNCVWAEPTAQPLHLGDVNAGVVYTIAYLSFYYLILDRIGIPLYPIISPRTYICIPSMLLNAGICVGNYKLWNHVLSVDA